MSVAPSTASEHSSISGVCSVSLASLGGRFCSLTRQPSGRGSVRMSGSTGTLHHTGANPRTDKRCKSCSVSRSLSSSLICV